MSQRHKQTAFIGSSPNSVSSVGRIDFRHVPAGATIGKGPRCSQSQMKGIAPGGLHNPVGFDAVAPPERLRFQGKGAFVKVPSGLPVVRVREALGDGRHEEHIADIIEIHQLPGLQSRLRGQFCRHCSTELNIPDRLKERNAPEIVHFEVRGTADVAAEHRLLMHTLEILQAGTLSTERAKAVAPA